MCFSQIPDMQTEQKLRFVVKLWLQSSNTD